MPIWLRNFTYQKIKEHIEIMNKQNQPNSITANTDKKDIKRLGISPTSQYSTKAPIKK